MKLLQFALSVLVASSALAQEDFTPYSGEEEFDAPSTPPPKRLTKPPAGSERHLSLHDETQMGVGLQGLAGLFLLESSRGQLAEPRFGTGARVTWEVGRATTSDVLRDALLVDVTWFYASKQEGTRAVVGNSHLHAFTIAPAWNFAFGPEGVVGFFLQAGAGLAYERATLLTGNQAIHVAGTPPVFQYGLGLRARPALSQTLRLVLRLELTRFRRSYHNDTFIGGSAGLAF